jgi:predicted nucleic acid-binding protein
VEAYFADASFWIAISSRRDQFHSPAVAWRQHLRRSGSLLVTTEAVLWEWMNAMANPAMRGTAAEGYHRCHRDPRVEVVPFDRDLIEAAVRLFGNRPDKGWSLTDCASFVIMERRKLTAALAADRHFQQAGFRSLLLEEPPID